MEATFRHFAYVAHAICLLISFFDLALKELMSSWLSLLKGKILSNLTLHLPCSIGERRIGGSSQTNTGKTFSFKANMI